jgi:chromosome segregation ATPase
MRFIILAAVCLSVLEAVAGCGPHEATIRGDGRPSTSPVGLEAATRDTEIGLSTLRAQLAEARIVAAKKEAELRDLRRQAGAWKQTMEAQTMELAALRQERDHLKQGQASWQTHLADLGPAAGGQRGGDDALDARVARLESRVAQLINDLERRRGRSDAKRNKPPAQARVDRPADPHPGATP